MIKMYIGLYVKYTLFLSDSNENWIFETDFRKKYSNIKFHENLSNGNLIFACRQTDRHDEANNHLSQFFELVYNAKIDKTVSDICVCGPILIQSLAENKGVIA